MEEQRERGKNNGSQAFIKIKPLDGSFRSSKQHIQTNLSANLQACNIKTPPFPPKSFILTIMDYESIMTLSHWHTRLSQLLIRGSVALDRKEYIYWENQY